MEQVTQTKHIKKERERIKDCEPPRKNKIGRPSKYGPEIADSINKYLSKSQDQIFNGRTSVNLPSVEGFALFLGVSRDTLYQWAKEHKEFSDTLGRLKAEQFTRLINNGLAGNYSSVITKLLLVTNHGMKEVKEEAHECFSLKKLAERAEALQKSRAGDQ